MRQWQSLHSHAECLQVTHLPQEGHPGHTFGACYACTTKHICIGVGGVTALETIAEPLSMVEWQAKLLEKLNLSGLKNWAPRNAEAAEQLVLSYHNIFVLDKNELGCTSTVEHEIHVIDSEPFKERFRRIPPPLLEEVCTSLRDMLDAGTIHPSQSLWCNAVVLVRKKDGTLHFCMDFR